MKLTPAWRNRLRNLTMIFLVLTVVAIIYTLIQWIRSEPGSFEPLNVLFFAVFSVASAVSGWISRADNVQSPASSEIALAETPAFGPLRQQIANLYSLEELRVLCLDVGIRYDSLSGDTIDTKAASLLAYADRRGQLNKLMAALQQERPQAKWPIPNTLQTLYDLRRNVRATWIDGVLKQSVTDEIALELNLTLEPHALTRKVAYVPGQADKPIEKEVPQLFADFGSLLILGEPGSGKTMTLLQLAESLLNNAEQDAALLTPIVLNLSSWANEQKPLAEWLAEELWQQYQLPRAAGQAIIQSNQLIYLFDGLDEVAEVARDACGQAINFFGEQHSGGLVVCCRVAEYDGLPHKLNLGMGVRIHPLSKAQVDAYFQRPELELETVHKIWQANEALQKMAQTPLFLSVITLAYRELNHETLKHLNTEAAWQAHLYSCYVAEMFKRRPLQKNKAYNLDQALRWLSYLADRMKQHEQTLFFLERLQPTWLPTINLYRQYGNIVGLFSGLVNTVLTIIPLIIGFFTISKLMSLLNIQEANIQNFQELGLIVCLFGGLSWGAFMGFESKRQALRNPVKSYEEVVWKPASFIKMREYATRNLNVELKIRTRLELLILLIVMVGMVLFSVYQISQSIGIKSGAFSTVCLLSLFVYGLWFMAGLQVNSNLSPNIPNQAIYSTFLSAKRMIIFIGFGLGLPFGTFFILLILLGGGDFMSILVFGVPLTLSFILFFGLTVGFYGYGGQELLKHYILRWVLFKKGELLFTQTDRNAIGFLDDMKDLILLRRVGGGWMFIHRTLLEYFASLHPNAQVEVENE